MQDIHTRLAALGIVIPNILLPKAGTDLQKWAVIACDQFTQDVSYWESAQSFVGDSPSTLNLIYPECYLGEANRPARITAIHDAMKTYLAENTLVPQGRGCVYIERSTPYHECRRGLVLCIDLEHYDWKPDSRPRIRSTEGTVEERLPPRMAVRRNAPLESSHILLLIDDADDALLPALAARAKTRVPLYETALMQNSGAISAWPLNHESDWTCLAASLETLLEQAQHRYGKTVPATGQDAAPFLFAVGDGNHSLASAKAIWEEYKTTHTGDPGLQNHPARYALVEVENLYDPAISFEPIHRALFGAPVAEVLAVLSALPGFSSRPVANRTELATLVADRAGCGSGGHCRFGLVSDTLPMPDTSGPGPVPDTLSVSDTFGLVSDTSYLLIESAHQGLATDVLQPLLDAFVATHQGYTVDYIHGEDALFQAAQKTGAVGILLPPINKQDLFKTIARRGPLPRKSFSMGEAEEKRFYLECRLLF